MTRAATAARVQSHRRALDFCRRVICLLPGCVLNEPRLSHRYNGAQISASTSSTLLSAAPSPNENRLERKVVGPGRDQLGGVGRAPSGQTDHEVEHLHGEDEPEEQRDLDDRQDDRHDHEAEPLPGAGAVDDGRFLDLHRHVLERAVEQEGEEGHPEPDVGDEDRPQGQVRVVQPLDRVVDQAEVHEQLVDGSTFGLEQEPEDDPGHDQRQQPGDDDERRARAE